MSGFTEEQAEYLCAEWKKAAISRNKALEAENAALKEECALWEKSESECNRQFNQLLAENEALKARLAEAQKESAVGAFVRQYLARIPARQVYANGHATNWYKIDSGAIALMGDTLDEAIAEYLKARAAIDSAIVESEGK